MNGPRSPTLHITLRLTTMKHSVISRTHQRIVSLAPLLLLSFFCIETAHAQAVNIRAAFDISGRTQDVTHFTQNSGHVFRVDMQGLHYYGQINRTLLERKDDGRMTIWLALRNLKLTISRTLVSGKPGGATCGPLQIVMGHQRDLWIALDVKQESQDGQPRLVLQNTRFGLPRDNWYVGRPSSVRTRGFGVSRKKVVAGLQTGLTSNRKQVEKQVIALAPSMLAQLTSESTDDSPLAKQPILDAVEGHLINTGYLTVDNSKDNVAR